MAVLIDTSVLIDAERRGRSLTEAVGDQDRAISVITAIEPLPITTAVARAHAEVWAEMENKGNLIGAHNLWIAATALSQDMEVATANAREFERVPGLRVVPI
jgi:predicted nucleic acid-binding protein